MYISTRPICINTMPSGVVPVNSNGIIVLKNEEPQEEDV